MAIYDDINVLGDLNAVTSTKGDLIVHNGTTNRRLASTADGYILTLDSAQTLGMAWAPNNGLKGFTEQKNIPSTLTSSATSPSPYTISDFTQTPSIGNYFLSADFTYSLSDSKNSLSFGVYINDILVTNSVRVVQAPSADVILQFNFVYYLTLSGADELKIKVFNTMGLTSFSLYSGNLSLVKLNTTFFYQTPSTFSTTSTAPVSIPGISSIPYVGSYVIYLNLVHSISRLARTLTVGLYKDSTLIAGSTRVLIPVVNVRETSQISCFASFSGSETLTVKINVQASDTSETIYNASMVLIPLY